MNLLIFGVLLGYPSTSIEQIKATFCLFMNCSIFFKPIFSPRLLLFPRYWMPDYGFEFTRVASSWVREVDFVM